MQKTLETTPVLDRFFEMWLERAVAWYLKMQAEYYADDRVLCEKFNNAREPEDRKAVKEERRKFEAKWLDRMGKGGLELIRHSREASIRETIQKDMEVKKARIWAKVGEKVGTVTECNLHSGMDGTPNGWIAGDKGRVTITTIAAGGYNIQCLHYRVLVK